jgi:hypothetical protein
MFRYALGNGGKAAVEKLAPCLSDDNPDVVSFALGSLSDIGPDGRAAAAEIVKVPVQHPRLLKDALSCLARIGAEPELRSMLLTHPDSLSDELIDALAGLLLEIEEVRRSETDVPSP